MATTLPEKPMAILDIPKEFGDDNGNFYRYSDEITEQIDGNLVKDLKIQLDVILICAGLFAAVNSTFLALTLPQMSPNSADDTNALLLQIALGGNGTITSAADLPSASFTPAPGIYSINVLLCVSLTLTLFSSFLGFLGQQWTVYYRKRGGGGPANQRWEQLRRFLGAKRWRLELVLNELVPIVLQLGLVIFCIAFALYLNTLDQLLSRIIASFLWTATLMVFAISLGIAYDPWCPFNMPWSRKVRPAACAGAAIVTWLGTCCAATVVFIARSITSAAKRTIMLLQPHNPGEERRWQAIWRSEVGEFAEAYATGLAKAYKGFWWAATRPAESSVSLQIIALRRVICTSEDRNAFLYSALNLQTIREQYALTSLAEDEEFRNRLSDLYQTALDDYRLGQTGDRDLPRAARVFSSSFSHLLLITGSVPPLSWSEYRINPSPIISLDSFGLLPNHIRDLDQGNSIVSSCDQCSHCSSLRFCMKVVHLIAEGLNDSVPTNFEVAYKGAVEGLKTPEALKVGCVVASVILSSKRWCDAGPRGFPDWPRSTLIENLFEAYRETSESEMVRMIFAALATAGTSWRRKPDHEIYVRLLELCLVSRKDTILAAYYQEILRDMDAHLFSIEEWVRDKGTSETDRQHGRDLQDRYIQTVARFFTADRCSFRSDMWSLIGPPLGQFVASVAGLMERNPLHSENPRAVAVLRRIKSSFPVPEPSERLRDVASRWSTADPQMSYLESWDVLDQFEVIQARNVYQALGLRYQRFSCIQQSRGMWLDQQEPAIHGLAL